MKRSSVILSTLAAVACAAFTSPHIARGADAPPSHGAAAGVFATDAGGVYSVAPGPAGVAAEVDGRRIMTRDVMAICLRKYRAPIIDQMVQDYVVDRECGRRGIVVSEAEIDAKIDAMRKAVAPQALEDVIAEHHSSMAEVRLAHKHKIERTRLVADQIPATKMTRCRAILVKFAPSDIPAPVVGTSRRETDALALIHGLQDQFTKGASFADLAAKYSDDASKSRGGDLGVVYAGARDSDPIAVEAALALAKGETSKPVRFREGYWLVQNISAGDAHGADEAPLYKAAQDRYVDEQAQFISPKFVVDLIAKSRVAFASDADCAPPAGKPLPEAAATVDGHVIPMKDVAAKCLADNGPRVVDILVQNDIVDRECKRRNIMVTSSEIDQRIDKLRLLIAPHTLDEGLTVRHMTLDDLRDSFQQEMERTRLTVDRVKPAPMAHCRAILVKFLQAGSPITPGAALRSDDEALRLIQTIQTQLKSGKEFAILAAQYSELDPKTDGGDIGVLYPAMHDMDTGILNTGLALTKGMTTSEPIKTVIGYCLVQSVSTSADHPKSEDAAYADALRVYQEQQAQTLIPDAMIALIKKSKVVYYVHS
ncbi:peptidylprolyl isomerase [Capsulimonas corticalis]|uniref:peptidylprolyl isomerase n=1 Tax=Capsulimonas corticalis TaxID=2219043 RepID=UPI000F6523C3|nr:peptidylprolyl isomerase [Capsulimonas corticalis]